jgi:hypothetical protein
MKPITIRISGEDEKCPGAFVVEQDGRHHDGLAWDEMIGQVISLTFASVQGRIARWGGNGLYPMKKAEELAAEHKRRFEGRDVPDASPESSPSDDVVF